MKIRKNSAVFMPMDLPDPMTVEQIDRKRKLRAWAAPFRHCLGVGSTFALGLAMALSSGLAIVNGWSAASGPLLGVACCWGLGIAGIGAHMLYSAKKKRAVRQHGAWGDLDRRLQGQMLEMLLDLPGGIEFRAKILAQGRSFTDAEFFMVQERYHAWRKNQGGEGARI